MWASRATLIRQAARAFKVAWPLLALAWSPAAVAGLLGDAALASQFADAMLDKGIYVIGFSFPVVPKGKARIRTQISAAHTREDLEFAIAKFGEAKIELGI